MPKIDYTLESPFVNNRLFVILKTFPIPTNLIELKEKELYSLCKKRK